tara:strand:+ start:865 stop:1083 length:219 start_codon:yes stop_codon:yes gene_type:complete
MKTQFLDIKQISGMCAHENTITLEFIDYDDKFYAMEIPTEELLTSFNNQFLNHAADILHKYIKKQINDVKEL